MKRQGEQCNYENSLIHGHIRKGSTYNISRILIDKTYGSVEVKEGCNFPSL